MADKKKQPVKANEKLNGVKGWLLTVIVIIGILFPVAAVVNVFRWSNFKELFETHKWLYALSLFDFIFCLILGAWGILIAYRLWRRERSALKTVKAYLITYMVFALIIILLAMTLNIPDEVHSTALMFGILRFVFAGLLLTYFFLSKRVKETYIEHHYEDVKIEKSDDPVLSIIKRKKEVGQRSIIAVVLSLYIIVVVIALLNLFAG